MTDTQDQLIVLPGAESTDSGANNAAQERAKRRSGSLTSMLLPELQALASSMGIATAKMRKSDLIAAIENAKRPSNGTTSAAPAARPSAAEQPPAPAQAPPATRTRRSATRAATNIAPTTGDQRVDSPAATPPSTGDAATESSQGSEAPDAGRAPQADRGRTRESGRYRDREAAGRDAQPANGRDSQPATSRDAQPANGRDAQPATGRDAQPANGRDAQQVNGRDGQQANGRDSQQANGERQPLYQPQSRGCGCPVGQAGCRLWRNACRGGIIHGGR